VARRYRADTPERELEEERIKRATEAGLAAARKLATS
jgi:hypothetical protein